MRNVWTPWQLDAAPEPPEGFINDIVVEVLQPICSKEDQHDLKTWFVTPYNEGGFGLQATHDRYREVMKWCDRNPQVGGPVDLAKDASWLPS